jgi:hypothetical protein
MVIMAFLVFLVLIDFNQKNGAGKLTACTVFYDFYE